MFQLKTLIRLKKYLLLSANIFNWLKTLHFNWTFFENWKTDIGFTACAEFDLRPSICKFWMVRKYVIPESIIYRINIIFRDWFCKPKAFFEWKRKQRAITFCKFHGGVRAVLGRFFPHVLLFRLKRTHTATATLFTVTVGNKCKKTDEQTDTIVINNNERKDLAFW